jgi:hypothetical protein
MSHGKRWKKRQSARRRGVILLVALGLLALFTVVVLTFVIVARQHQQAAIAQNKGKSYDAAYEEHLNQAALQILRGTSSAGSVLGPHSLLEDLYGSGLKATIAPADSQLANGGFKDAQLEFAMGATGKGGMMYIKLSQAQMKPPINVTPPNSPVGTGVFESIRGY